MQSSSKTERLFSTVIFLLIIAFGVFIRVQNRDALEAPYLFGPDSYRYFRQTRQIVESGELPRIDTMRNSPAGIENAKTTPLFPYVLANGFAAGHKFFPSLTLYPFAIFSSIFFISLAALILYAFTKRLFGKIAALFATLIFVSIPQLILISFTGYVDTDAIIIFLFLAALALYAEASFRTQPLWKRYVYTLLSGITISILGLIWKGVGFAITVIVFFNFLCLCREGYDKYDFAQYTIWLCPILAGLLGLTKIYRTQLFAPHVLLAIGVPIAFGVIAAISIMIQSRTSHRFGSGLLSKIPLRFAINILFLFLGCILLTLTHRSFNWISTFIDAIFYPFGKNGVMEFVSELHPTPFDMWREDYGLLLLFAIPGLCFFTYIHPPRKRKSFLLHCTLVLIAVLGIAVSRFVPLFTLPFPLTDSLIFAIAAIVIVVNTFYQCCLPTHQAATDTITENHSLLISAWFIPGYMLACSAQRFHLFLAPLIAILSGYMLNRLFKKYMPSAKNNWLPLVFLGVLLAWQVLICGKDILTFLLSLLSFSYLSVSLPERAQLLITLFVTAIFFGFILQDLFYRKQAQDGVKKTSVFVCVCLFTWLAIAGIYRLGPTQTSFITAIRSQPIPDSGTRDALNGFKTNIPPHAVIAANWNFGSLINELGRRTTIVDEEQNLEKIREMSKAVFCGKSEDGALRFLKEHKATHIFLHPMDLSQLNLHVLAATERRENIEQFHQITPLKLSDKSDQKLEYLVDHPMSIKINTENLQEKMKRIIIPFKWESGSFTVSSPASIVIRDGNSEKLVSVKGLIIADRQWYFPEAEIDGCVWKHSEIVRDVPFESADPMALYISPEAREYLTFKLFFGEHSDHFKLIYESPKIYGPVPIKIWEIQYKPI